MTRTKAKNYNWLITYEDSLFNKKSTVIKAGEIITKKDIENIINGGAILAITRLEEVTDED